MDVTYRLDKDILYIAVEGRIDAIEELDVELLHGKRGTGNTFKVFTTACY